MVTVLFYQGSGHRGRALEQDHGRPSPQGQVRTMCPGPRKQGHFCTRKCDNPKLVIKHVILQRYSEIWPRKCNSKLDAFDSWRVVMPIWGAVMWGPLGKVRAALVTSQTFGDRTFGEKSLGIPIVMHSEYCPELSQVSGFAWVCKFNHFDFTIHFDIFSILFPQTLCEWRR